MLWPGSSGHSTSRQDGDPESVLTLYREALALRGAELAGLPEAPEWTDAGWDTLRFDRPGGARVLLASGPLDTGTDGRPVLTRDTTVWLRMAGSHRHGWWHRGGPAARAIRIVRCGVTWRRRHARLLACASRRLAPACRPGAELRPPQQPTARTQTSRIREGSSCFPGTTHSAPGQEPTPS